MDDFTQMLKKGGELEFALVDRRGGAGKKHFFLHLNTFLY